MIMEVSRLAIFTVCMLLYSTTTVVGMLIMEVSRLAIFTVCMLLYYYRGGYVDHGGEQAGYLQRLYVALGEVAIQLVQVNQHQAQL